MFDELKDFVIGITAWWLIIFFGLAGALVLLKLLIWWGKLLGF